MNLRGQLNNIDIRENDGSITNLGENMEKKAIREQIFAARKKMSESERLHNSSLICKRIMEDETFAMAACVYAYMDCKGEVGMEPLLRACWETGKPIAVPKVFGKELRFFYINSYEDLASGYFHIPEPIEGLLEAKEERALMIVPGVAFDLDRHRCGYGGGFYDRYLEIHRNIGPSHLHLNFRLWREFLLKRTTFFRR